MFFANVFKDTHKPLLFMTNTPFAKHCYGEQSRAPPQVPKLKSNSLLILGYLNWANLMLLLNSRMMCIKGICGWVLIVIIHQIFSLAHDWPKHVTWPNIPQLKLGNIREYSPIFKTSRVANKIWRIINTVASIWGENMLGYLSLDIICFSNLAVCFWATLSENCSLLETVRGQIS